MPPEDLDILRVVSLHQPWASLAAALFKPFETRSWKPPSWLIGRRIGIHAARKCAPLGAPDFEAAVAQALGSEWRSTVPRGALLCTGILSGAWRSSGPIGPIGPRGGTLVGTGEMVPGSPPRKRLQTDLFGDYGCGRWIWGLSEVEVLPAPRVVRGRQRLWKWPRGLRIG